MSSRPCKDTRSEMNTSPHRGRRCWTRSATTGLRHRTLLSQCSRHSRTWNDVRWQGVRFRGVPLCVTLVVTLTLLLCVGPGGAEAGGGENTADAMDFRFTGYDGE
ncbi:hypothetical protein ACOMHN_023621 [Nucella lapillus]